MTAIVNVNGKITSENNAVVSVFDHGFLYGEGVYETLRTYNGQPFLFDRPITAGIDVFDQMRRRVPPFAEAQGLLTDEDVFKIVS